MQVNDLIANVIGYFAAIFTTIAYIPQVVKVYKTKRTDEISLGMFTLMSIGVLSWFIYGIMISSVPVMAANFITFLLSLYILVMKIKLDYLKKKLPR